MSNLVKTIAKNSGYVLASNIIAGLLALAINIYIARYLGKEIFGNYSLVIAYLSFFLILANLGIDIIVTREISKNKKLAQRYINSSLTLKTILTLASMALACLIIMMMPYSSSVRLGVLIGTVTLILYASTATFSSYFQSNLEMIYVAISNVLSKVIFAGLMFYVIYTKGGFIQLIIACAIGLMMQSTLLFFVLRKRVKLGFVFDRALNKKIIREAIPLALVGLFVSLYYRLDVMMLSLMKGESAVGLYSAAYNLTESPTIIPAAFMVSIFPLMAIYYKKSKRNLKNTYEISSTYMLMIAVPLAAGTTLLSARIIQIMYGNEYAASSVALSILVWSTMLVFLGIVNSNTMIAIEKQLIFTKISAVLLIVSIGLNLLLIPKYSFVGASLANLFSQTINVLLGSYIIHKSTGASPLKKSIGIICATAFMAAFIYFVPMNIIATIVLAIAIYALFLCLFRVIDRNDLARFKKILSK